MTVTPLPDGLVRMDLPEGALYLRLAPDALLAFDERGELLASVSDVGGRAALVGGKLSEP